MTQIDPRYTDSPSQKPESLGVVALDARSRTDRGVVLGEDFHMPAGWYVPGLLDPEDLFSVPAGPRIDWSSAEGVGRAGLQRSLAELRRKPPT